MRSVRIAVYESCILFSSANESRQTASAFRDERMETDSCCPRHPTPYAPRYRTRHAFELVQRNRQVRPVIQTIRQASDNAGPARRGKSNCPFLRRFAVHSAPERGWIIVREASAIATQRPTWTTLVLGVFVKHAVRRVHRWFARVRGLGCDNGRSADPSRHFSGLGFLPHRLRPYTFIRRSRSGNTVLVDPAGSGDPACGGGTDRPRRSTHTCPRDPLAGLWPRLFEPRSARRPFGTVVASPGSAAPFHMSDPLSMGTDAPPSVVACGKIPSTRCRSSRRCGTGSEPRPS